MTHSSSVQAQFGANAAFYVTHETHAKGASLGRLVDVLPLRSDWLVLDVATGAGHTAFAVAPHVRRVLATDLTPEMLEEARQLGAKRAISNVDFELARAEELPFEANRFDLVTCRIAPHHFDSIPDFLTRAYSVLKPNGSLVVIDNLVPEGAGGDYVNAFEKLRDPSHAACFSDGQWQEALASAGFKLEHREVLGKRMNFGKWASRHDARMQEFLKAVLMSASTKARGLLQPRIEEGKLTFGLHEGFYWAISIL